MPCPVCGLVSFYLEGRCGICHYDVVEDLAPSLCDEEDF